MAKREIKFSLVYRDMWQSSGKYVPRVDQLVEVAPAIIDMGCFDRVETNGGAFEQVNLLFGENPNKAVRAWTAPFHKAGIQTHMLERGLNALRMNPVPNDVRELMFKVKKIQGTDIARSFCGLNDHRNLKGSVLGAKKGGMISQVALSITHSPVHTVAYYMDIVDRSWATGPMRSASRTWPASAVRTSSASSCTTSRRNIRTSRSSTMDIPVPDSPPLRCWRLHVPARTTWT